ncbi:MAG: hypothetical protein ACYDCM_12050 [Candidatus Acidiferrales bacterium]
MNPRIKLDLMTAVLLTVIVSGTGMAHPKARPQRTAQTDAKKSDPSVAAGRKASPASGCSLLTPAMIEKATGQPFQGKSEGHKAMPMYTGGAWGSTCTYHASMRIDFSIYAEASSAKAKDDFDKLAIGADDSKGRPAIGESAFWSNTDSGEPYVYVLKGKVYFLIGMGGTKRGDENQMRQTKDLAAAIAARI